MKTQPTFCSFPVRSLRIEGKRIHFRRGIRNLPIKHTFWPTNLFKVARPSVLEGTPFTFKPLNAANIIYIKRNVRTTHSYLSNWDSGEVRQLVTNLDSPNLHKPRRDRKFNNVNNLFSFQFWNNCQYFSFLCVIMFLRLGQLSYVSSFVFLTLSADQMFLK